MPRHSTFSFPPAGYPGQRVRPEGAAAAAPEAHDPAPATGRDADTVALEMLRRRRALDVRGDVENPPSTFTVAPTIVSSFRFRLCMNHYCPVTPLLPRSLCLPACLSIRLSVRPFVRSSLQTVSLLFLALFHPPSFTHTLSLILSTPLHLSILHRDHLLSAP